LGRGLMKKKGKIEFSGTLKRNINGNRLEQTMYLFANRLGFRIIKSVVRNKIKKGKGGKKFELKKDIKNKVGDEKKHPETLLVDIAFNKNDNNQECFTLKIEGEISGLEIKPAIIATFY
jgi:hypothetical protein